MNQIGATLRALRPMKIAHIKHLLREDEIRKHREVIGAAIAERSTHESHRDGSGASRFGHTPEAERREVHNVRPDEMAGGQPRPSQNAEKVHGHVD